MSLLNDMLKMLTSSGEESDALLADLLKPESMTREEAQETYDACLGYDPTTYFDKRDIGKHIDNFIESEDTPDDVATAVVEEKDLIAREAFARFDEYRQDYLMDAVSDAITDVTGYDAAIREELENLDDEEDEDEDDED